uniref:Ubiquitin-like domain-containing protein n=1 Tax=Alexandrium monilatum TaxID=311494 RepID=A0A7S4PTE2_9DINO|mmetsp:Transcript_104669/g.332915  ORF Transcript_104669/g.332915 Transcript_104669/m.332915 type:complete len:357 (+) Transcript_104669:83-1153(+)
MSSNLMIRAVAMCTVGACSLHAGGLQHGNNLCHLGGEDPDLLSLMQTTPAKVLQRAAERGGSRDGNALLGVPALTTGPQDGPALKRKNHWLLLEISGAGLVGLDRMFLGGSNVPMGLMKLLWNVPSLGLWSTVDRAVITVNALRRLSAVSTLDMNCSFSHVEDAYALGVVCASASLVVLAVGLLLGLHLAREAMQLQSVRCERIVLGMCAYLVGTNIAIALSIPLLALSVPASCLLVVVRASADVRARWLNTMREAMKFPSSPEALRISVVKAISGQHLCEVEADPAWVVARLKTAIRSQLGIPTTVQRLVFRNRPLLDSERLADHLPTSKMDCTCSARNEQRSIEVGLMQYQCIG